MQATQKIFIGFVAFCATLGAAIGIFLYASAIPYFFIIGKFVAGLFITVLVCASIYAAVWTYAQAGIQLAKRRNERRREPLITHGDVAAYLNSDGTWEHLSSKHIAAGVPRMLPAPKDETLRIDDETIIEMYKDGATLMDIVEWGKPADLKYNRVQAVVAAAKKRGDVL